MRKVAIYGMIPRYPTLDGETEVWITNNAYGNLNRRAKNLRGIVKRVYFTDELEILEEGARKTGRDFVEDLNTMECDVWCRRHYDEIPRSRAIPAKMLCDLYRRFFVNSISYAMAMLLYEIEDEKESDPEPYPTDVRLTLAGMFHTSSSQEYLHHVHCMNYWIGRLEQVGVEVINHGPSMLACAFPWQSDLYGWEGNRTAGPSVRAIAAAWKLAIAEPVEFYRTPEFESAGLSNPRTEHYYVPPDPNRDRSESERQEAPVEAR